MNYMHNNKFFKAHCISDWDFRPSMSRIGEVRSIVPNAQWVSQVIFLSFNLCYQFKVALSATAPNAVRQDIITTLKMENPVVFERSARRTNLYIDVVFKELFGSKPMADMSEFLDEKLLHGGSAIIYTKTRAMADTICDALNSKGRSSLAYHRGLKQEQLQENQQQWMDNKVTTMVATIAFGLGKYWRSEIHIYVI